MTDRSLRSLHTPENRIMLLTAGGPGNDDELRALLGDPALAWGDVVTICEWERALPPAWTRIAALAGDSMPPDARQAFSRLAMVCEFQLEAMRGRFEKLVRAFGERSIDIVPMKGASLAIGTYAKWTDRPMGDLDLLVPVERAREAWETALSLGWTWDESTYSSERYAGHHHLPPMFDAQRTGAKLELHTTLSVSGHPFAMSFEELAKVSSRRSFAFGDLLLMPPEEMLVHISVHFAWAHFGTFGIWRLARDLDALGPHLDWDRVRSLADRYSASSSVYWSLFLARELSGVDVAPPGVLDALRPARVWLRGMVERHMALHVLGRRPPCPSVKLRRAMWSLALDPARVAVRGARPWESEEVDLSARHFPQASLGTRLREQWASGSRWREYLRQLRVGT